MTDVDDHFLPGVSFTLDGESVPASELCWVMTSSCGCTSGAHMMTEDTITERDAWKAMSGTVAEVKRAKERGFTIKMLKISDVNLGERCAHTPQWGYAKPPHPTGHSWATTDRARVLHLVPLTEAEKGAQLEWVEDNAGDWSTWVISLCGTREPLRVWSRKWWRIDGKVECSRCVKAAEKQVSA